MKHGADTRGGDKTGAAHTGVDKNAGAMSKGATGTTEVAGAKPKPGTPGTRPGHTGVDKSTGGARKGAAKK